MQKDNAQLCKCLLYSCLKFKEIKVIHLKAYLDQTFTFEIHIHILK